MGDVSLWMLSVGVLCVIGSRRGWVVVSVVSHVSPKNTFWPGRSVAPEVDSVVALALASAGDVVVASAGAAAAAAAAVFGAATVTATADFEIVTVMFAHSGTTVTVEVRVVRVITATAIETACKMAVADHSRMVRRVACMMNAHPSACDTRL